MKTVTIESDKLFHEFKVEETAFVNTDDIEIDREESNVLKTETIESDKSFHEFKVEKTAFVNTEELETPLTMCDADVKPSHVCKKCKRKFKSDSKFKIHTRLCISVGSQRPFKCNDCGSAFKESYHLNLHQKPINRCNQLPIRTPKSSFESFLKQLKRKE